MFGHDKNDDTSAQIPVTDQNDDQSMIDQTVEQMPDDALNLPATDAHPSVEDVPAEDYIAIPTGMPLPSQTPEIQPLQAPDTFESSPIGITPSGTLSNLGALRQDALHELSPLIGYLDQTPDEKYATAKMVYEETKDQNILSAVYEAAKNLPDEKAKAEAIYDVISKINSAN